MLLRVEIVRIFIIIVTLNEDTHPARKLDFSEQYLVNRQIEKAKGAK